MMGLIIAIHVLACILLIIIILIQAGRGGGLVEGFSNVESMFGPKTNAFLTRTTTVFSIIFFVTCLSLALLSARQSRSLMKGVVASAAKDVAQAETPAATTEAVKPAPQETPKTDQQPPKTQ